MPGHGVRLDESDFAELGVGVSDESRREQVFPDGAVLPVPVHPRFVIRRGSWCWVDDDGESALPGIRAGWPLKWQSCCAVAVCTFRALQRRTMHAVVAPNRFSDYVCQPKQDAEIWESEFAKTQPALAEERR